MNKIIFAVYIFLISVTILPADIEEQPFSISSKVDKNSITIGDIITYSVEMEYNKGIKIFDPGMGANLGQFEVKDFSKEDQTDKKKKTIKRIIDYKISTYFVGDFEIPPLEYKYIANNKTNIIKTEPIKITVKSVKASEEELVDIRDIKEPLKIKSKFPLLLIIIIVLIITAAIIIYLKLKNKKLIQLPGEKKIEIPPYEIAMQKIKELEKSDLIEKDMIKEYYSTASDILREYLENELQFIAMEMITSEIIAYLENTELQERQVSKTSDFLDNCDMVKFAKFKPGKNEIKSVPSLLKKIIDDVNKTRPRKSDPGIEPKDEEQKPTDEPKIKSETVKEINNIEIDIEKDISKNSEKKG